MNSQERKERPVYEGFIKYFPDAIMEIANHSWKANEKHNPGEQLYWNRDKSTDESDALIRHLIDYAKGERVDDDGLSILTAIGWRAMAFVQKELEKEEQEDSELSSELSERINDGLDKLYSHEEVFKGARRFHNVRPSN